jgi:hypothetical protein
MTEDIMTVANQLIGSLLVLEGWLRGFSETC